MKTFFQTFDQKQAMQKAKDQAKKHGVPFTASHVADGWAIRPCLDKSIEPCEKNVETVVSFVEKSSRWGVDFLTIASETGLSIKDVLGAAAWINSSKNRHGKIASIMLDVDRSGKVVAMHKYVSPIIR